MCEIDGASGNQRGEFAEAVARDYRGRHAMPFLPQTPGGDTGDQHGWLRAFGLVEFLDGAFTAQAPQVVAQHARGFIERGTHHGRKLRKLCEHAHRLGSLAGKNESDFVRHGRGV